MFFKETNFDQYFKLILTALFRELAEEEKMLDSLHCLQELKDNIHFLYVNSIHVS